MAYNPTTKIITAPVGTPDLQKCFAVRIEAHVTIDGRIETVNVLSGDIGVNCALETGDTFIADYIYIDALGTHVIPNVTWTVVSRNEINKWAKYKPERADGMLPLIHGDATSGMRSRFANNFGLKVPYCTNNIMNAMVYSILDDYVANQYWQYLKPRGDVQPSQSEPNPPKEYFRITDFVQLPTDTTDPNYQQVPQRGYNHNAPIPFKAYISSGGVTEKSDIDGTYYEVNVLASDDKFAITFINSIGNDLHLQDFITIGSSTGDNDYAWRPVLQVFNGSPDIATDWWERGTVDHDKDVEFAGDAISSAEGSSWVVEIPLDDSRFSNYINKNGAFFHVCVGVGLCKKNLEQTTAWKGNNDLFIMPYDEEDIDQGVFPFYYRLLFVRHFDRHLTFINMVYGIEPTVISFNGQSTVNISANASGTAGFEMTVDRSQSQALKFVGQYGTLTPQEQLQGYTTMKICLVNQLTGDEYYLSPVQGLGTSQRSTSKSDAYVPSGSGPVTLYGTTYNSTTGNAMDVGQLSTNAYWHFQVKVYIGASDQENASGISIHKLSI
jgi:hypothetical protein